MSKKSNHFPKKTIAQDYSEARCKVMLGGVRLFYSAVFMELHVKKNDVVSYIKSMWCHQSSSSFVQ